MIRRFTIASIGVLALLIVTARAIGSTNKPPALAMLDPGDCPQPCWHGIRPGVTTAEEAKRILNADSALVLFTPQQRGIYGNCWRTISNWMGCSEGDLSSEQHNVRISMWPPRNELRLGDAINLWGNPLEVIYCSVFTDLNLDGIPHRGIFVSFAGNVLVVAYEPNDISEGRVKPDLRIQALSYEAKPVYMSRVAKVWTGFSHFPKNTDPCRSLPIPLPIPLE